MKKTLLYLSFAMLWVACSHENKAVQEEEKALSHEFDSVVSLDTSPVAITELMNITDWNIIDTVLICKNSGANPFYYVFNTTDFRVMGKFGRKGKGENEWGYPHLIPQTDSTYTVIDNVRWGVYNVTGKDSLYSIQKKRDMGVQIPLNSVKPVSSSTFASILYTPKEVSWKIMDIDNLSSTDSIVFFDETKGKNSTLYDFSYDVSSCHAAFAYLHLDGFVIASLTDDHHVSSLLSMKGDGQERKKGGAYYTDVICRENYIYLLSQREAKTADFSGTSSIEVYDYEGNPIKKILLDIIASSMVYDEINQKVIFRSSMDNDLYVVDYAFK